MHHRAVIFDLFGTLAAFPVREPERVLGAIADGLGMGREDVLRAWPAIYAAHELGATATFEEALAELAVACGVELEPGRLEAAAGEWRRFQARILVPRADAEGTLRALRDAGCRIGLLANSPADVPPLWAALPLARLVHAAVFSCVVRLRKPDPRSYHLVCRELGVNPEECLFVGDGGSAELSGALRAGMQAVQLIDPFEDPTTAVRLGREEWGGPRVRALSEVVPLVASAH